MKIAVHLAGIALVSLAFACGGDDDAGGDLPNQYEFGGDRPVFLDVPDSYDHPVPTPLVVVLHGFGANGFVQLAYTHLDRLVSEHGALLLAPDGTVDPNGKQFWNATDACCDGFGSGVDDVGYLTGLIAEVSAVWNVDPKRIYLFGHSNGGYMSYRMACEKADTIAAIVSLAGATFNVASDCSPSESVSVLQIHGDADETVPYTGGTNFPSASRTVELWAGYDGCTGSLQTDSDRLDVDTGTDGTDTVVARYDACPAGVGVELWTIEGGGHIPVVTDAFPDLVWDWMQAHAKQ